MQENRTKVRKKERVYNSEAVIKYLDKWWSINKQILKLEIRLKKNGKIKMLKKNKF